MPFRWVLGILIGLAALCAPAVSFAEAGSDRLAGCWVAASTGGDPVSIRPDSTYTWGSTSGRWAVHGEEIWLLDADGSGGVKWHYLLSAAGLTLERPEDFAYLGEGEYLYFQVTSPELTHRLTRALSPERCRADEAASEGDRVVAAAPRIILPLGEFDALVEIVFDESGKPDGVGIVEDPQAVIDRLDLLSAPGIPPLVALETVQTCGDGCRWWFFEAFALLESSSGYELEPAGDRFRVGVQDSDSRPADDGSEVTCLLSRHAPAQLDAATGDISLLHQFELTDETAIRETLSYSSISERLESESSATAPAPPLEARCLE